MIIAVNVSKTVPSGTPVNHPSILPHADGHWMLDKGSGKGLLKAQDSKYQYIIAVRDGHVKGYYKKGEPIHSPTQPGRVIFNISPLNYPSKETFMIDRYINGKNLSHFVYKFFK